MKNRILHKELLDMQRNLSRSKPQYVSAAREMLYLAKAVDLTFESLYSGLALERALWRYEALWLPLVVALTVDPKHSVVQQSTARKVDEIRVKNFARGGLHLGVDDLVPPIDIAWVWHLHRLNPEAYAKDTAALTEGGGQLEVDMTNAFRFSNGEDGQSKRLRKLWKVIYPFEAFVPRYMTSCTYAEEEARKRQSITSYANEKERAGFRSCITYDIAAAAGLQRAFLWNVCDPDPQREELFASSAYLNRAYDRYLLFLALHKRAANTLLVPMKDINILWQMHLSCTKEYTADCVVLVGNPIPHDSLAVEKLRLDRVREAEAAASTGDAGEIDMSRMEESEIAELERQRAQGVSIKETKTLWESNYGASMKYDLPDTYYRGQPPGERGGFKEQFENAHGTARDVPWTETIVRMLMSIVIVFAGMFLTLWAFYKTIRSHFKFIAGVPTGLGTIAFGFWFFLAIPISRPLSSESRFWLDKSLKQAHNPLPPYLVSSTSSFE